MRKKGVILALAALACAFVGTATACKDKNSDFTGFKEGSATTVMIGDTLRIDEFIDIAEGQEYTLTASNGIEEVDLSGRPTWYPEVKGKWTLTLTIKSGKNKGTYTMEINVDMPYSKMAYKTTPLSYPSASTITFDQLLRDLMVDVSTLGEYTLRVYNVRIGKNIMIEFDETDTEYTFDSFDTHYFTFGIETEKGEILKAIATVNVQEADVAAIAYCEKNNIEMYGYRQLLYRDGALSAEMSAGSYTDYFKNEELPYIAFKGNYTTDSYLTVDFTGKNIPQTAFFCDVISKSLYDKNQGIYISHGTVTTDGGEKLTGDHSCLTYFGPYKMKERHVNTGGSFGREGWMSTPHAASRVGLQDGAKYRYIVGYSNGVAGVDAKNPGSITLHMLLINLDTNEIMVDMTKKLTGNNQTGILEEAHFDGSIVLYANYGVLTKWDNIHLIEENVADIHDLYPTASFKSNAKEYALKGDTIEPEQFVTADMLNEGDLYLSYKANQAAAEGAPTPFDGSKTIDKAGVYRITYVPDSAETYPRSMVLYANENTNLDFEDGIYGMFRDGYRAGVTLFDEKNITALQQAELDKNSNLTLEAISGDKSVRLRVGQIFADMYSTFGLDLEYLDKVFAEPTVDNVVFKMRSDYTTGMDYQKATYSNGAISGSTWLQNGVKLVAGRDIFVTISRDDYEAAKLGLPSSTTNGLTSGLYAFRFLAPKTTSVNMFNVMIDDFSVGTRKDGGTFIYKDGVNLTYTFDGTVSGLYIGGKYYKKGAEGCKVTFNADGNTVTIPSSEIAEFAGQEIQIVGETDNGMEIVDCAITNSLSTTVLSYGNDDPRNSETMLTYNVTGTIESVKVGDDSLEDYCYHEGGVLYIAKEGLAKYAGQEGKVLSIKLAGGVSLEIALNITAAQLPTFETNNEILPFTTENIGATEIVDVSDKKLGRKSGNEYVYDTPVTGKAYKMELPKMEKGEAHKIVFPFEFLEEVFSQPGVDAFHFNIHLTSATSGYASDGFSMAEYAKGFHTRGIDRGTYEVLAVNRADYVWSVPSAWHKDSVEYLYIDNIRMTCNWSTTQEATFTKSEAAQGGAFVYGFFGNVTNVSFMKDGASVYEDVTQDFELQGDVIILKAAKAEDTKYALGSLKVQTDAGVEYLVKFKIEA